MPRVPGANDKVVAQATSAGAGGPALNAALTSALLTVDTVLVSTVGDDAWGRLVAAEVAATGTRLVDVAGPGFTIPLSTVLVTRASGERAVVSRNAVGVAAYAVDPTIHAPQWLDGVTAVLVDGHHLPLALAVAREARRRGIPVLLDGGSWKPGLDELLGLVDVAVVSADFVVPNAASSDPLPAVLALGPRWAAQSAGPGPVRWAATDGTRGAVAVPRVPVVDTLGAGDVLHGALLAALADGGIHDLVSALQQAVEVAARSVSAPGARGWAHGSR